MRVETKAIQCSVSPVAKPVEACAFATPLGVMTLGWSGAGITSVRLPDRGLTAPGLPDERSAPRAVNRTIKAIRRHLAGKPQSFADVLLDLSAVPDFHRRVYEAARAIPPGRVLTYGELAKRLGCPGGARAVGQALGRNPVPLLVPCHRIVAAGSKPGGFSAPGGLTTKARLLALEGFELVLEM